MENFYIFISLSLIMHNIESVNLYLYYTYSKLFISYGILFMKDIYFDISINYIFIERNFLTVNGFVINAPKPLNL